MKEKIEEICFCISMVIVSVCIFMCLIAFIIILFNTKTDHECYMMSDKEFYSSEQCKPYWSYRQVGKK